MSKWKITLLGIQHVLAMYAGAVAVPLIVGPAVGLTPKQIAFLISIDFFCCGIATLLQVVGGRYFGIRLPIVLGCTFTAVGPMIAIGKLNGITAIYGSIIVAGLMVMIFSQFFGKVMRFFPPVVTGSVVMIIGTTLIPVAMNNAAGGLGSATFGHKENLFLASITLVSIILINRFFKGYIRALSVLLGLIIGTTVAAFVGMVHLNLLFEADWFQLVRPLYFGVPTFHLSAILAMILVCIVSMVESTGVFMALGEVCEKKLDPNDVKKGLRAEGLAIMIGGAFNSFPYTSFSQNVGLVALTKVRDRYVVVAAGLILMVLGLLPKVAALTMLIPTSVLGGAMIAMFGMVFASGVRMLSKVDLQRNENLLIVACSVGVGLGTAVVPQLFEQISSNLRVFFENGIVVGSVLAIILNIVLNGAPRHKTTGDLQEDRQALTLKDDDSVNVIL